MPLIEPASTNLDVPPHQSLADSTLLIGEADRSAA